MAEENIKVAVRVRPFNDREKTRKASCCIQMANNVTTIINPKDTKETKSFTFDYSYWSHDGFREDANKVAVPENPKYADQDRVYKDLGQPIVDNAFAGFNCTLFAYGQTGSGKSYSVIGYGSNTGIVVRLCNKLFDTIKAQQKTKTKFQVSFSMVEMYMEEVRDLLGTSKSLKVRENSKLGRFYVDGLSKLPVSSFSEISTLMDQGTTNRTVAATNMNATSSRSHMIVTVTFDQTTTAADGTTTTKSSEINIVDLAGSERVASTGATGSRLKEGAQINLSLSALGNVISALADAKVKPNYRESVLTKLLANALGGNSKTIMIAALSPADINYDETLSTLRYADRAKQIKTKAVVNESQTDRLIRELREENERMKIMLANGQLQTTLDPKLSEEQRRKLRIEIEAEMRAQLRNNEEMIARQDTDAYAKKMQAQMQELQNKLQAANSVNEKKQTIPFLSNVNEDVQLSGVVVIFIEKASNLVGRQKSGKDAPDIPLGGLGLEAQHATIIREGKNIFIIPCSASAQTRVNGQPLTSKQQLKHQDRLLFGASNFFLFNDPTGNTVKGANVPNIIDWQFVQSEVAAGKGMTTKAKNALHITGAAEDEMMELVPQISEVNAISEALHKNRTFELIVLSGSMAGLSKNESKVMVKMINLENGNKWMFSPSEFSDRRFRMQALMRNVKQKSVATLSSNSVMEGDNISQISDGSTVNLPTTASATLISTKDDKYDDPFVVQPADVIVGVAHLSLSSLLSLAPSQDELAFRDYKGRNEGSIVINISPCNAKGNLIQNTITDQKTLIGQPLYFKLEIKTGDIRQAKYAAGVVIKFNLKIFGNDTQYETERVTGTLEPSFNFSKIITIPKVTSETLKVLENETVNIFIYGYQSDENASGEYRGLTSREIRQMLTLMGQAEDIASFATISDSLDAKESEVKALKTNLQKVEIKELAIKEVISQFESGEFTSEVALKRIHDAIGGVIVPSKPKSVACCLM